MKFFRQTSSLKQTFLTEKRSSRPVFNKIKRKLILQIVTIHLSRFSRIKQIKFINTTLYFTTSTIIISQSILFAFNLFYRHVLLRDKSNQPKKSFIRSNLLKKSSIILSFHLFVSFIKHTTQLTTFHFFFIFIRFYFDKFFLLILHHRAKYLSKNFPFFHFSTHTSSFNHRTLL